MAKKDQIEKKLLENILRAAKKSKDPFSVAQAYGILVDKLGRCSETLGREIKKTIKDLFAEIERSASVSNVPGRIAMAFGIVIDKKSRGSADDTNKSPSRPIENEKERLAAYDDLEIKDPYEKSSTRKKKRRG